MKREQTVVAGALLLFCACFGILAAQLSITAGRLPLWVAALTLVPIVIQLKADLLNSSSAQASGTKEKSVLLSVLILLAGLYAAGFLAAFPLFAGLYWRRREGAGWPASAVVATTVFVVLFAVFQLALPGVDLYAGALWNLWGR